MIVSGRRDVTLLTRLPELPWAIQLFFLHFPITKLCEPFTWERKRWLGYRASEIRLASQAVILTRAKESTFLPHKCWLKLTRVGGWPTCPGQLFAIAFSKYKSTWYMLSERKREMKKIIITVMITRIALGVGTADTENVRRTLGVKFGLN